MSLTTPRLTIGIAGSRLFTTKIAEEFFSDPSYSISFVLSPSAKPVGKQAILTDNPLHIFAQEREIPSIRIAKRIDQTIQQDIQEYTYDLDILLVVDFGYRIPEWLLHSSKHPPLNVHPSKLPEWRGSSPGQAVLLSGASTSAVTVIQMDELLDHGPILFQESFVVSDQWFQSDYYQFAFDLSIPKLPQLVTDYALGKLTVRPQPEKSPTPIARELSRDDGYVAWELIRQIMDTERIGLSELNQEQVNSQLSPYLGMIWKYMLESYPGDQSNNRKNLVEYLVRASRALSPWPGLWTTVQTVKGEKRMKLLELASTDSKTLNIRRVQIEGQQPALWNQIKNSVVI